MSEITKKVAEKAVEKAAEIIPTEYKIKAGEELGKALEITAKTIHCALKPLSVIIWGFEQIEKYLIPALAKRLEHISPEKIRTPSPNIAGPAIEALRFTGDQEVLREMYANLLATSMNEETAINAHPAFVEILRQLSSDEARIVNHLGSSKNQYAVINVDYRQGNDTAFRSLVTNLSMLAIDAHADIAKMGPAYLNNLERLGLIEISMGYHLADQDSYKEIESHPWTVKVIDQIEKKGGKPIIRKGIASLTVLGHVFYKACCAKEITE